MLDIAFIKVSIVLNVKANASTKIDIINRKYGRTGYRINDIDAHPNEECQRFIAEVVSKTLDL